MRVTTRLMATNTLRRLSERLENYESVQERLATGRRINRTSDDPASSSRQLVLNAALRARGQELRNAGNAMTMLDSADAELQSGMALLHRVNDLAIQAGQTIGPQQRQAIAAELTELRDALVGIANARNGERPLFAGTSDGNAVEQVAGVWTYTGDAGTIQRRVSAEDRVNVNVRAEDVFGFGTPQGDVFTIVDDLVTALNADDYAGRQTALGAINDARDHYVTFMAEIGATANRVEAAMSRNESNVLTLRGELAEVQDVHLEEAIMDLRVEEVAYEATLQALGRSLPQSLVAFLR